MRERSSLEVLDLLVHRRVRNRLEHVVGVALWRPKVLQYLRDGGSVHGCYVVTVRGDKWTSDC